MSPSHRLLEMNGRNWDVSSRIRSSSSQQVGLQIEEETSPIIPWLWILAHGIGTPSAQSNSSFPWCHCFEKAFYFGVCASLKHSINYLILYPLCGSEQMWWWLLQWIQGGKLLDADWSFLRVGLQVCTDSLNFHSKFPLDTEELNGF